MIRRHPIGHVVEIDGPRILVNLFDDSRGHVAGHPDGLSTVGQPGDVVGIEAGALIVVLRIDTIAFAEPREIHHRRGEARGASEEPLRQMRGCVLGTLIREGGLLRFAAVDRVLPVLGAGVFPLSNEELEATIGDHGDPDGRIVLGHDARNPLIPVAANLDHLLGRHLAVLGATGQGKTHFVAAVLQQLARAPRARIVVFDVNGEYGDAFGHLGRRLARTVLGRPAPGGPAVDVRTLRIPYYALGRHGLARLLLPSEKTQMPALRFAIERLRFVEVLGDGAMPVGQAAPVFFDDCRAGGEAAALQQLGAIRRPAPPVAQRWPHMRALSCLAAEFYALKPGDRAGPQRNAFAYGHIHSLVNRIRGLIDDDRFQDVVDVDGGTLARGPLDLTAEAQTLIETVFGAAEQTPDHWSVHVIDLSQLTQDLMPFVLGALLELYAAELFRRGPGQTHPTLLALEEAHHYLRQLPGDAESGQHALAYERLAKEGRKFGVSLLISTQRPSEVSPTVLAQCGTWAVFRLSNENDQRAVMHAAEGAAAGMARQIPGLARGEAMVLGAAMPVMARLSVIRADPPPRSSDPPFRAAWSAAPARVGNPVTGDECGAVANRVDHPAVVEA